MRSRLEILLAIACVPVLVLAGTGLAGLVEAHLAGRLAPLLLQAGVTGLLVMLTAITVALAVRYAIVRRLEQVIEASAFLREGVMDARVKTPGTLPEVRPLAEAFNEMADALEMRERSLAQAQRIGRFGNWEWEPRTGWLFWSPQVGEITGLKGEPSEYEIHELMALVNVQDRKQVTDHIKRLLTRGGRSEFTFRINRWPGGDEVALKICAEISGGRSGGRAAPIVVQGTVQDVTARTRAEAEVKAAVTEARAHARAHNEFMANMNHELRTPLNAIIGFSDMLESGYPGALNEQQRKYVADINEAGRHLLGVISDVLEISSVEAGRMQLREAEFSFNECIEACVSLVRPRAEEAGLTLEADIPASLPPLNGDRAQIRQAVLHILNNAVKFTKAGHIQVRVTSSLKWYVCEVIDTGIGINAENLGRVMENFQQVESAHSRSNGGTGLGLPLARAVIEQHGGKLELESEPGRGTQVTIRVPTTRMVRTLPSSAPDSVDIDSASTAGPRA